METPEEKIQRYESWLLRYENALKHVVAVMEPLNSNHTKECIGCEGCLYEWEDALLYAMNALAGLEPDAHLGPPHKMGVDLCGGPGSGEECERCAEHFGPGKERRKQAWLDYGFVHEEELSYPDKKPTGRFIWRRGTAF